MGAACRDTTALRDYVNLSVEKKAIPPSLAEKLSEAYCMVRPTNPGFFYICKGSFTKMTSMTNSTANQFSRILVLLAKASWSC